MSRFSVVQPGDRAPDTAIHDKMRAALEQAIIEGALGMLLVYETADQTLCAPVPNLTCVRMGLLKAAFDMEMDEGDD